MKFTPSPVLQQFTPIANPMISFDDEQYNLLRKGYSKLGPCGDLINISADEPEVLRHLADDVLTKPEEQSLSRVTVFRQTSAAPSKA